MSSTNNKNNNNNNIVISQNSRSVMDDLATGSEGIVKHEKLEEGHQLETTKKKHANDANDDPSTKDETPDGTEEEARQEQHYSTRGRHLVGDGEKNFQDEEGPFHRGDPNHNINNSNSNVNSSTSISIMNNTGISSNNNNNNNNNNTTSFLDSLGEDERRVRTRHLPDVDGIHVLDRDQIRSDLRLARRINLGTPAGITTSLSRRTRKSPRADDDNNNNLDTTEETSIPPSDDDAAAVLLATAAEAISNDISGPCKAFLALPQEESSAKQSKSPHMVEALTAHDPPRPPESIGAKKKHRMLRWERRPQEVEVDLSNYRKTVARTRKELQIAEGERERIDAVASTLRCHFLEQLRCLNEEGKVLDKELGNIQGQCVKAADLLQSRTRSRGTHHVMKDVIAILKAKVQEQDSPVNGESLVASKTKECLLENEEEYSGMGGVNSQSFIDWDRSTQFQQPTTRKKKKKKISATGWILPGNKVQTPYGSGFVVHTYSVEQLDPTLPPVEGTFIKTAPRRTPQHGFGINDEDLVVKSNGRVLPGETKSGELDRHGAKHTNNGGKTFGRLGQMLAPRACVKLQFGFGFFPLHVLTASEDVSTYSDSQLANRWGQLQEAALDMTGAMDIVSMSLLKGRLDDNARDLDDVDDKMEDDQQTDGDESQSQDDVEALCLGFLPYGSGMLPTTAGRGLGLESGTMAALEYCLQKPLFDGKGILGKRNNMGVSEGFREWEDQREELSVLRAKALQRRNEVSRQRRIRILNERTYSATRDRTNRVEGQIAEMRADLKSLKDRLDCELQELGIGGDMAEHLLSTFYEDPEKESLTEEEDEVEDLQHSPKRSQELMDLSPRDGKHDHRHHAEDGTGSREGEAAKRRIPSSDDEQIDGEGRPSKRARPSGQ